MIYKDHIFAFKGRAVIKLIFCHYSTGLTRIIIINKMSKLPTQRGLVRNETSMVKIALKVRYITKSLSGGMFRLLGWHRTILRGISLIHIRNMLRGGKYGFVYSFSIQHLRLSLYGCGIKTHTLSGTLETDLIKTALWNSASIHCEEEEEEEEERWRESVGEGGRDNYEERKETERWLYGKPVKQCASFPSFSKACWGIAWRRYVWVAAFS